MAEIEVVGIGRIECGLNSGNTGITDRTGRQTNLGIGVVGAVVDLFFRLQLALVVIVRGVQNGCVTVQEGIRGRVGQSVIEYRGNGIAFQTGGFFLFNDGSS